jgi:hypothetical protein
MRKTRIHGRCSIVYGDRWGAREHVLVLALALTVRAVRHVHAVRVAVRDDQLVDHDRRALALRLGRRCFGAAWVVVALFSFGVFGHSGRLLCSLWISDFVRVEARVRHELARDRRAADVDKVLRSGRRRTH